MWSSIPSLESPPAFMSEKEEKTGSPSFSKESEGRDSHPPDVEQFWHDRDTVPCVQDNDPIPGNTKIKGTGA